MSNYNPSEATLSQIAERFKAFKKGRSLRTVDIERTTGISHSSLADIEKGRQVNPFRNLYRLCQAYGLSHGYFLDEIPSKKTELVLAQSDKKLLALEAKVAVLSVKFSKLDKLLKVIK
jgi:transcriptional regulator with XRE-family HTH domain